MVDFRSKEKEILDFWDKNKIFQKSVEKDAPSGEYLFYDGPPFATGTPHYGHLVASIMKDAVPRYWTMKGYRVARQWGWDCHGLPIENIVEKELGIKKKKDILELGVDKFNETCRSKVLTYADEWKKTVRSIGRWVDMENPYMTMDKDFMETVWWVFKQLWDKELIYEDYRSMHICPRCETTLSQSEVTEGYKDIKDLSLTAKFELVDEPGTFVLAWTTTPWTLIGNAALAVGEDIDYAEYEVDGQKIIIAKERVESYQDKFADARFVREFKGKELVGKAYKPLFPYYAENEKQENRKNGWKIYATSFVTTEEGTGVVHIAPAFGEDDMNLGREKNLPFLQHVNMDGSIKEEATDFAGMNVKPIDDVQATDVEILKYLNSKGTFFSKQQYEHSYPHCWRCKTPLLNYATSSYFVAVTKIKDQLLQYASKVNWSPSHIKQGRFGKWLEGARDWSISRQRFWASVMPIWKCDKCDHSVVFGSVTDLEKESGQKIDDLHKHIIDKITISCHKCAGTMHRIPDVLDTWFDSGSMSFAQYHYPFENKEMFDSAFPAHFIAEGADQTRAWFYYMHVIGGAIKEKNAYQNVIVNGIVLAEDGKKMSKSLNNYPDPNEVIEKYGADALRMYLFASPVMQAENFNFTENDLQIVFRRFTTLLQNIMNFYLMFCPDKVNPLLPEKMDNDLDKWIVSKLYLLQKDIQDSMEGYNLVKASRPITDFIDILSTWYVRRSRDRFKGDDEADKQQAKQTLAFVLNHLAKLISPFAPMTAESIYMQFENEMESVHLENWPEFRQDLVNQEVMNKMDTVRGIAENVHALRAKTNMKVRQPLALLQVQKKSGLADQQGYLDILADELNVVRVEVNDSLDSSDGWQQTEINDYHVSLNTNLTDELKDMGAVRELVRHINSIRKEAELKPSDSPIETYQTESEYIKKLITDNKEELIKSTSAGDIQEVDEKQNFSKEVKVAGEKVILGLRFK